MASIISAGTTSGTALNMAGDTSGVLQLATNGSTTAITVDTSQNVGIGTTTPTAAKLHLYGSGTDCNQRIEAPTGTNRFVDVGTGNTGHYLYGYGSYPLYFGANGAERMRIDTNGYVTKPYQVAFNAYNAASGDPVLWATANLNIGSAYNTSTGRFTAPIAGRYLIYISIHAQTGLGRADFRLKVNGAEREGGAASQSSTFAQGTGIAVLQLAASDYVTVGALASFSNTQALSYFGGYLLG